MLHDAVRRKRRGKWQAHHDNAPNLEFIAEKTFLS
jgi:hypothetical protein